MQHVHLLTLFVYFSTGQEFEKNQCKDDKNEWQWWGITYSNFKVPFKQNCDYLV